MKSKSVLRHSLVLAGAIVGGNPHAQSGPDWEIVSTFPFSASQAVASDPTGDVIYMGAGSGFLALDGGADDPEPKTGTGSFDYRARCGGFVRDIKVTANDVWVAGGVGGLQRWSRVSNEQTLQVDLLDGTNPPSHAWSIDIAHIGANDYAIVGTNDLEIGGKIFIVEVDGDDAQIKDIEDLGSPIYAVAASNTLLSSTLSILVGKRCDSGTSNCDSLRRYDVSTSNFTFPTNPSHT